jgi:acetylornithine deacetylase/succinyl-diaminopimelate desuccinylase-like protein
MVLFFFLYFICKPFLIGHYDKQPHMEGWREGLGPTTPVVDNGKLYGRGAIDDGYAVYGAIASIKACQEFHLNHPRCIIIIEGDEESEG